MTMVVSAGQSAFGYHRAATVGECERLYAFKYGLRLEPKRTADALALGSLVHIACMHRYRAMAGMDALDPVEAIRRAPVRIAHMVPKAEEVWRCFEPWALAADRGLTVLDVEREYEARIDRRRITARLDLVAKIDGELRVLDHKTTSGDLRGEVKAQAGAGQIALLDAIGQSVVAPAHNLPYGGVWITAIASSGAEPVAVRGRARPTAIWRETVLTSISRSLARAEVIESRADWRSVEGVLALPASPEACRGRYRSSRCAFYDACRHGPDVLSGLHSEFDAVVDDVSRMREAAGR